MTSLRSEVYMSRLNKRSKSGWAGIAILAAILCFPSSGCNKNTGPDKANVIVINGCGTVIDVYMDEEFKITVDYDSSSTLEEIDQGTHTFKAIKNGSSLVVAEDTYEIYDGFDFNWAVDGPSTILVTNQYGEALMIYAGNKFLGELQNGKSEHVTEVPFGLITLNAVRNGETSILATTTLDITEVKEYEWTITP